jgi:putative FmdB family regulatory protein
MPIYEYRCDGCSHEFETIQKISEEPLQKCPECEQNELVKKVSAAGFRLKGGGWYETDFKSGNKRNVSGDKSEPGTSSSSSSDGAGKSSDGAGKSADSGSTNSSSKSSTDSSSSASKKSD